MLLHLAWNWRRINRNYTLMRQDLQGLEITKGELKRLSGLSADAALRPATIRKIFTEILKTFALIGGLGISCIILILGFPSYDIAIIAIHILIAIGLVINDFIKIAFSHKFQRYIGLLEDVDRYNAVIHSIDINDQIEAAGNPSVRLNDREKVIQALQLTREDLVRALKTERVIRENQNFMRLNPELFANNLTALAALQVGEKASEYGKLLNEAFEIGLSIQKEMRQLQQHHKSE